MNKYISFGLNVLAVIIIIGFISLNDKLTLQNKNDRESWAKDRKQSAMVHELARQAMLPSLGIDKMRPKEIVAWTALVPRTVELGEQWYMRECRNFTTKSYERPVGYKFFSNGVEYTVVTGVHSYGEYGSESYLPKFTVYIASQMGGLCRYDAIARVMESYTKAKNDWQPMRDTFDDVIFDDAIRAINDYLQPSGY